MKALEIQNLSKTFLDGKTEIRIFDGANLSIEQGESVAIIGPSGSGKSTLLHILSLLEPPTSGKVFVNEEDTSTWSDKRKAEERGKNFSFIFQNDSLFSSWSLEDNVLFPIILKRKITKEDRENLDILLKKLSLTDRRKMKVKKLSGGEKSRVSLLRAIIADGSTVFLDEPTGALDSDNAKIVEDLIFSLEEDFHKTIVLVTHSVFMAERAKSVYKIENKSLVRVK